MTTPHPFRFGIMAEHVTTRDALISAAQRAETLGYATFLIRDHFIAEPFGDQFAPSTALVMAAAATTTLRVGTMVFDNDYRHPVLLAKEAATLDVLSGGRLELGIGAGWARDEYARAGMSYDAAGVRITRLEESLHILKGLFAGEPFTFSGAHYQIAGLQNFPVPTQRPSPPILIGGGRKRVLSLAGREANIVGVLTSSVASGTLSADPTERLAESVAEKIGWIRAAAGDRFPRIELSLVPSFVISDDREKAAAAFAHARGWDDISVAQALAMPSVFIGSFDEIAAEMTTRREQYGFSYYVVSDNEMELLVPVVAQLAGK